MLLEVRSAGEDWRILGRGKTDAEGRVKNLLPAGESLAVGAYRLTFDTADYFRAHDLESFYPEVSIIFVVRDPEQPYHIPVLLSPYGYTTYRGS